MLEVKLLDILWLIGTLSVGFWKNKITIYFMHFLQSLDLNMILNL
jgi:hypothetical protein